MPKAFAIREPDIDRLMDLAIESGRLRERVRQNDRRVAFFKKKIDLLNKHTSELFGRMGSCDGKFIDIAYANPPKVRKRSKTQRRAVQNDAAPG